jgi:hypothetical protein
LVAALAAQPADPKQRQRIRLALAKPAELDVMAAYYDLDLWF